MARLRPDRHRSARLPWSSSLRGQLGLYRHAGRLVRPPRRPACVVHQEAVLHEPMRIPLRGVHDRRPRQTEPLHRRVTGATRTHFYPMSRWTSWRDRRRSEWACATGTWLPALAPGFGRRHLVRKMRALAAASLHASMSKSRVKVGVRDTAGVQASIRRRQVTRQLSISSRPQSTTRPAPPCMKLRGPNTIPACSCLAGAAWADWKGSPPAVRFRSSPHT